MPELPEVETTRRGIEPHLLAQTIETLLVRNRKLRWPIPYTLKDRLAGGKIERVDRRGKYILLSIAQGTVLVHLGMSGSLRVVATETPPEKHDHVDLVMKNGKCLRFRDPRRFGSVLWAGKHPLQHKLLKTLGPEPLGMEFTGDYLFAKSRFRSQAVKPFIMNSRVVVGVGNIYASEALFLSGIHPLRAAGRIARGRYELLARAIRRVLVSAIEEGGTTLRDFVNGNGEPGYFAQRLNVYGRGGEPCYTCGQPLRQVILGQRSSFYCPTCQH